MAGAAETAYGVRFSYLPYLALHAPVLGVLKGIALAACVCLLFLAQPSAPGVAEPTTPLSAAERRLGMLLLTTLILWMTDTWHGIPPAWVGLAAASICLLPRVGFLTGDEFASGVNLRTCIYIAGIFGLTAVVAHSGLGDLLGHALLAVAPLTPGAGFRDFASLVSITTGLNFVVTANGVPALFTPLARTLADASGLPLLVVLMVQVIGYATPVLPYQASPIVVAMAWARCRHAMASGFA